MKVYIVTAQGSYGEWYEIVSVHADKDAADEARVAYARRPRRWVRGHR